MPCHPGQRVETSRHSFVAQGEGRTTHCPYWKQLNQQKQCRQPPAGHGHARAGLDDADIGQAAQHVGVVVCAALICAALRRGRCCCAVLRRGRCAPLSAAAGRPLSSSGVSLGACALRPTDDSVSSLEAWLRTCAPDCLGSTSEAADRHLSSTGRQPPKGMAWASAQVGTSHRNV